MDDVAHSKKGDNYSWEKMHDLTLSKYTVIHQHFPAFLPARSQPPSSSLFPFAPKKLGHPIEGAGALGRTVKLKERPWFVKAFFFVKNLEAPSLLRVYFSQELNVTLVSFPFLFFVCFRKVVC